MRILLVHNFYGSSAPSGENQVFEAERNMLRQRGHEVFELVRHSDEIRSQGGWGALKGALATPWNPWMAQRIRMEIDRFRPDVVHAHNTFPLISPAIFYSIATPTARVLTLHNYRLFCPAAVPMRQGAPCTECLDRQSAWPAVRHGCYRGSRVATAPVAANVAVHRGIGTWRHQVDAFITFTDFQRARLTAAGLPSEKLHVKPNFYAGRPIPVQWENRRNAVVFAGRLTEEKGAATLVAAWREWTLTAPREVPELRIVGDGPLRSVLQSAAEGLNISFTGALSGADTQTEISRAKLLVIPSKSLEGFPLVLGEAFAFGTPVAASELGPLPSLVTDSCGALFAPGDAVDAVRVLRSLWMESGVLSDLSRGARTEYEEHYTEAANHDRLMEIYANAISSRKEQR